MPRPIVFLCYSTSDEQEKETLLSHLHTLHVGNLFIEEWDDHRLGVSSDWEQEISAVLAQARVAVLLISPDFLISDYILLKSFSKHLERRKNNAGLPVFAVIAKPCAWEEISWLATIKVRPRGGRPVWDDASKVDEDLTAIAQEIAAIATEKTDDDPDQDRILVSTSDGSTQTIPLSPQGLTIGRKPDNDLVLHDRSVSRRHARIEFDEMHYRVIDLESTGGTYLANVRLPPNQPQVWTPGQLLRIGNNQMFLRCITPPEPAEIEDVSPPPPQPVPDQPTHFSMRFKLQLTRREGLSFQVHAIETPMGEPRALSQLPYSAVELTVILKALRMQEYDASRFKPEEEDVLKRRGLLLNSHLVPDLATRIGQDLYDALITGDVHTAFQMALAEARTTPGIVSLQLRFDEEAVELVRYPWELLYHRRALLPSRAIELVRYISYPEAVTALPVTPPLRLLYIESRPSDLPTLPDESEQTTVRQALDKLAAENILSVDVLSQPTYDGLLNYLEADPSRTIHLLHFDGHGVFARQCLTCGAMNYPHSTHCQADQNGTVCGQEIASVKPQGYLAFERGTRHVDWITSEHLGSVFYNRRIRLAVLSACRSSSVGGEVLFGGIAPALIQAGIPAVVATQLPISTDVAVKFMRGFYGALARFESVPAAVNAGRTRVFRTREWFIPTLYLRSRDDEGHLLKRTKA